MKRSAWSLQIFFVLLWVLSCASEGSSSEGGDTEAYRNREPIILLHGLNGFARENYSGYWYWGGFTDLEQELKAAGYDVRTASVGPVSSNWDRSCEFYACLKGGTVDYGEAHAARNGHDRFGENIDGIFPEWGENRKIHIIGHSMGGTTARMVAQLLAEGSAEERESSGDSVSPLFTGGKDWIKSITTIATPHDGSTLTYEITSYRQRELLAHVLLGFLVKWHEDFPLYNDIRLDHWDWTERRPGEEQRQYEKRIESTVLNWNWTNKDFADFDLSPEGAWEMNGWVSAQPDIYYFSWSTRISVEDAPGNIKAHPRLSLPFYPIFLIMSQYKGYRSSLIDIDESWLHNDGMANTVSMDGPDLNSADLIHNWGGEGIPLKGIWNHRGELYPIDHAQIIGMSPMLTDPPDFPGLVPWYLEQAAFLSGLP